MTEQNGGTIRRVAWSEAFPWVRIARVFKPAISGKTLVLGAVGVLLTALGWGLIGGVFFAENDATDWLRPFVISPWKVITDDVVPNKPALLSGAPVLRGPLYPEPDSGWIAGPLRSTWYTLTQPARELLTDTGRSRTPLRSIASLLLCGLWGVAVWAFFGAAICRIAALSLAAEEQIGLGGALRHAARKWPSYFAAPLLPLGGVLAAAIPVIVLGWIMRSGPGLFIGGLLWPLALLSGFIMALLLLGLLFGWPLMWATISTENSDSFDALSRSYAYLFQRPLHFIFYVLVAGFIGWLGWVLVQNFAAAVVWMAYWAAGWGTNAEHLRSIMGEAKALEGVGYAGGVLVRFFADCVKLLAVGYVFSYFWAAAAAVYLFMRKEVDATDISEIALDADTTEPAAELPSVTTDEAGAPVVAETPATTSEADTTSPGPTSSTEQQQ